MSTPVNDDDQLLEDYFGGLEPVWTGDSPVTTARRTVTVPVTKLYGDPLYGKPRGVRIDQGTSSWIRLVLISPTGGPAVINVGAYSSPPTIAVRYREATGLSNCIYEPDEADIPELASDGKSISFPVPDEVRDRAGVYRAQLRICTADGDEVARDEVTVLVDRGFWLSDGAAPSSDRGPPTMAEVRTALRDHPGANRLLGDYEFDAAEIGQSIVSGVQTFMNGFPPLPLKVDTITWPSQWRRQLLDGTTAYLFETAASYLRRGNLPYTAGGLTIDDLKKEPEYLQAAMMYRQRFAEWIKSTRTAISLDAAWGSVSSGLVGSFPGSSYTW
jgi:hypothetical protein